MYTTRENRTFNCVIGATRGGLIITLQTILISILMPLQYGRAPLGWRNCQNRFIEWTFVYCDSNFIKQCSNLKQASIGSAIDLVPNQQQAITLTDNDLVYLIGPWKFEWYLLSNCPNMNAIGLHWWSVSIGSGNGLVPSGNKPLPEPMLTQIFVTIWRH